MAGKKATNEEVKLRVLKVRALVLQKKPREEICLYGAKEWGVKERQVDNYIAKAKKQLIKDIEDSKEVLYAEHLAARWELRERARQAGDMRLELDVLKDEAKLIGLYAASQLDINLKGEELDAAIEHELARMGYAAQAGFTDPPAGEELELQ
jgi:hypothetical protein